VEPSPAPDSGSGSSDTITDDDTSNTGSGDSTSSTEPVYPAEPIVGPVYYVAPYGDDSRSKAQAANSRPRHWRFRRSDIKDVVALRNSNHIIIEGFEIKNGAARGVRSDVSSTNPQIISHITLRQNWIHHNGQIDPCATSQQRGIGAWRADVNPFTVLDC
jgi:hypothetical protein